MATDYIPTQCWIGQPFVALLVLLGIILAITTIIVANLAEVGYPQSLYQPGGTYYECCDNQTCSDTYYEAETDDCHLVLCEHNVFSDKSRCKYPAMT
jgi:hypothetical protein